MNTDTPTDQIVSRETFTPMVTPGGHTVHLVNIIDDHPFPGGPGVWNRPVCNRSGRTLQETTVDDPRPTCRLCASPPAQQRALRDRESRRTAPAARDENLCFEKLDSSLERLKAMTESIKEQHRARQIRAGIDPASTERTIEQIRAETIALRAQNDQALAEMRGAWRTYD